jgi:hypothetical protein
LFRGKKAAGIDVAGAAIGALGLLVFALLNGRFLLSHSPWLALTGSTGIWLAVSLLLWQIPRPDVAPTDRKPKIPAWHPNIL